MKGVYMLASTIVQEINGHLRDGNIAAALVPLESAMDVRAKELPSIEKATLAALRVHLRGNAEAARVLAEAALHPNISVRRFVRKLAQSLKTDAAPLAKPLRRRIERYVEETIALDYTFNPQEAAWRREQADVLDTSVELLRRCDLDEFMDYLGALLIHWSRMHEMDEDQTLPRQEAMKAYGEAAGNLWRVRQRRSEAIFAERYAHLGLTSFELHQTSPRLWNEFQTAVQNDPEVLAAQPAPLEFEYVTPTPDTTPKTLMEQSYNVSRAFAGALDLNVVWQPDKKPGEGQEKIRDQLWGWLEEAICTDDPDAAARVAGFGHVSASNYFLRPWLFERAVPLLTRGKEIGRGDTPAWDWLLRICCSGISRQRDDKAEWPREITPDMVRALKSGDKNKDRTIDELARRVEAQLAAQSTPVAESIDDEEEEDDDAELEALLEVSEEFAQLLGTSKEELTELAGAVPKAAARFNSVEERVEALCNPPIIKQQVFLSAELGAAPRTELLDCWRKAESWKHQETPLREAAMPRLFEKLREARDAYRAFCKRRTPLPQKLNEAVEAVLTEQEKKELKHKKAEEEEYRLMFAMDDVIYALKELGDVPVYPRILDTIGEADLQGYRSLHMQAMLNALAERKRIDVSHLPIVRELCARWEQYCATLGTDDDADWKRKSGRQILARSLYLAGAPQDISEARLMVQTESLYDGDMARVARERSDTEMLVPLMRALLPYYDNQSADLTALWEDTVAIKPEAAPACVAAFLDTLAEVPDVKQARPLIELLESLDKKSLLFANQVNALMRCVESPVPQVARFALERLSQIDDAEHDWTSLCETAGEKLWSENLGLAKDAAKFLGAVGARYETAAPVAWTALSDALSLDALPLLEVVLRSMGQIQAKQSVELDAPLRTRLQHLNSAYAARLGKLCERLLNS
ncbi:MAG TPA: hypothetical protein VNA16_00450 [Abditibacteriaceae bacterium]|nr:hypothetical protein [Abditibacteriaceae bacterium]